MPRALVPVPKPENSEKREIVKRLRGHFSDQQIVAILGVPTFTLDPAHKQGIGVPAARLGYVLLRMMETPHVQLSPLEIICLGKYGTFHDPKTMKTPQGILQQIKDSS